MNEYNEQECQSFIIETVELLKEKQVSELTSIATSTSLANSLTADVEFWKWMGRNFPNDFSTAQQIADTVNSKPFWARLQLQGKGYEWDWVTSQRNQITNMFSKFNLGDSPTAVGVDAIKSNVLTGQETGAFQHKAYTGNTRPDFSNMPKDATVVTNVEKSQAALDQGYTVESYKTSNEIASDTNKRFDSAKSGTANTSYSLKAVSMGTAKAGAIGAVIGASIEAIASYGRFKRGEISKETYLKEILKSGGNVGLVAGGSHLIMLPISATLAAAGASTIIAFPIAFFVGAKLNKVIAPMFGRGEYAKLLGQAKHYDNLADGYREFVQVAEDAAESYEHFVYEIARQHYVYNRLKEADKAITGQLADLYTKI